MNTPENSAGGRRKLYTPVLSAESDLGPEFVHSVLDDPVATAGPVLFEQYEIFIEHLPDSAGTDPSSNMKLEQADAVVLLAHFMDALSLQAIRSAYHRIMAARSVPLGVFIFRPKAERQFKISCEHCGQKLWILEQEIGMRGRCINCRRPMMVPTPSEYLRQRLMLPDAVPVLNVMYGDTPLCRGALANLLARTGPGIFIGSGGKPADFLKKATVPIHIDPDVLNALL